MKPLYFILVALMIITACKKPKPLEIIDDSSTTTVVYSDIEGVVTTLAGSNGVSATLDGTGTAAQFKNPAFIASDSKGNLFVSDASDHVIRKITPAGVVTTFAGIAATTGSADNATGTMATFNNPQGIVIDSNDNLFVADENNHTIRKITPSGAVTTFAGTAGANGSTDANGTSARFDTPEVLAIDSSNNIFVGDRGNLLVRKITSAGVVSTIAGTVGASGDTDGVGTSASFGGMQGIAVDSSGNIFVADTQNQTIRKIDSSNNVTTYAGASGVSGSADGSLTSARFQVPCGMVFDKKGNLFISDNDNHTIRKISKDGTVSTLAGSAPTLGSVNGTGSAARFHYPLGLAVDPDNKLYVVDAYNYLIRKIR